jgi:hypothetical protein
MDFLCQSPGIEDAKSIAESPVSEAMYGDAALDRSSLTAFRRIEIQL